MAAVDATERRTGKIEVCRLDRDRNFKKLRQRAAIDLRLTRESWGFADHVRFSMGVAAWNQIHFSRLHLNPHTTDHAETTAYHS